MRCRQISRLLSERQYLASTCPAHFQMQMTLSVKRVRRPQACILFATVSKPLKPRRSVFPEKFDLEALRLTLVHLGKGQR